MGDPGPNAMCRPFTHLFHAHLPMFPVYLLCGTQHNTKGHETSWPKYHARQYCWFQQHYKCSCHLISLKPSWVGSCHRLFLERVELTVSALQTCHSYFGCHETGVFSVGLVLFCVRHVPLTAEAMNLHLLQVNNHRDSSFPRKTVPSSIARHVRLRKQSW